MRTRFGATGAIACGVIAQSIGFAPSVGAQGRNVGESAAAVFMGHQLTASAGTARILYAPSESDDPTYRNVIAERIGGSCDYFDARFDTPSPSLLATYDCVHTWSNYPYSDPALFGNRLADYVDGGGKVILGAFAASQAGNALAGRLVDPAAGYTPVTSPGNHEGMSAWDGMCREDCVWEDIAGLYANHRQTLTVVDPANGFACGNFVDGEIAVAYIANRRVYVVNGAGGFPIYTDHWMAWVVANACDCVVPPTAVLPARWSRVKILYR
jgi:hypothetical protein